MQYNRSLYNGYLILKKERRWLVTNGIDFHQEYASYKKCIKQINRLKEVKHERIQQRWR